MLEELEGAGRASFRKRKHLNLHRDYSDPAQRLLNYVDVDSYIRPHCHVSAGCEETLIAVTGLFGVLTFQGDGAIEAVGLFGSELYLTEYRHPLSVIIGPNVWHSVLALSPGAVLLECKAGPFDPGAAKDFASWAPAEGTAGAALYLAALRQRCLEAAQPELRSRLIAAASTD